MESVQISVYLSELLSLPSEAILDEEGSLSSLCLMELNSAIEMPAGFFLTEAVRVPEYGEYFLDARALVETDRLVVYKAIGNLHTPGLILETEEEADSYLDSLYDDTDEDQFGSGDMFFNNPWPSIDKGHSKNFNWALCELHGGCALFRGQKIELLSNYMDPQGVVSGIMIHSKKLVLANVSELTNLPIDELPKHDLAAPMASLLENMLKPPSPKKALQPNKTNRMNLKFEGNPPDLDDLLNDLF